MTAFQKGSRLLAAALFCFSAEPLRAQFAFSNVEPLPAGEARVRLAVPAGTAARVDSSADLAVWNGFLTVGAGTLVHTDSFAGQRFYRAAQVPTTSLTGDHLSTDSGDLVIRPVTHASFVLSWNGKMIYNDPDTATYTSFPKADLILVGHEHGDHLDAATITAVKAPAGLIIASQAVYNALSTTLRASTIVLANGASTNVLGLSVEAVPAYNANHPKGSGNGYILTLGGRRVYMSGDTGNTPEMRALQNIDVAFLAMNVPFTMSINDAATATRAFRPRIVYPYHFRNQDGTFANLNSFKTLVGTDLPIEVRLRKWF